VIGIHSELKAAGDDVAKLKDLLGALDEERLTLRVLKARPSFVGFSNAILLSSVFDLLIEVTDWAYY